MKTIEVTYYVVTDGISRYNTLPKFATAFGAEQYISNDKDKNYLKVREVVNQFEVFDDYEDYKQNSVREIRKRAIAKLSKEEIIALGFSED